MRQITQKYDAHENLGQMEGAQVSPWKYIIVDKHERSRLVSQHRQLKGAKTRLRRLQLRTSGDYAIVNLATQRDMEGADK